MRTVIRFVLVVCLGTSLASSPSDQEPELHWAAQLGLRVHQIDQMFPLIDRVVLVPDAATYVDELNKWSPQGRWPVLIEDDRYAPLFIRRFQPREVIRRESVGQLPQSGDEREKLLESTALRAFGGDATQSTFRKAMAQREYEPPGAVIASVDDPAWTAAVALAAGRGQPLLWLNDRLGSPNEAMGAARAHQLAGAIEALIAEQGYEYAQLGDAIGAITICRAMPGRVELPSQRSGEIEPAAMTDFLGRHPDGSRYAIASWIFGDEIRSAYVAMCSLFLPRDMIRLFNTYPNDGPFLHYNIDPPGGLLAQRGFEVAIHNDAGAKESDWLRLIQSGLEADVLLVHTRGNVDFFDLADARMTASDVPLPAHPAAVHFTHSWSMRRPADETTIAGRFLEGGAYAYVGSVHEPTLAGFVPPMALAERWSQFVPVLVAARHWDDEPHAEPWKVNLYGDPLMVAVPPALYVKERIEADADYGVNLREVVRKRMRDIEHDESGIAIADSIAMLEVLGRDEIAVQLWRHAVERGVSERTAAVALGPLFRKGDPLELLRAFGESGRADALALDMLWQKVTPKLWRLDDAELLLMQRSLRRPHTHGDLARLAPHLARAFGSRHVGEVIERELEQASHSRTERELRRLLSQYQ